jgi:hypothetical protein
MNMRNFFIVIERTYFNIQVLKYGFDFTYFPLIVRCKNDPP